LPYGCSILQYECQNCQLCEVSGFPGPTHSGGNDRFCARLKTDFSAFRSGLQGHLRSCLAIPDSSWQPLSKNVKHDLVRPRRPELEAEMSVFNLAQKRSFPPLCAPRFHGKKSKSKKIQKNSQKNFQKKNPPKNSPKNYFMPKLLRM
jgi:hypothetical protein